MRVTDGQMDGQTELWLARPR